MTDKLRVILEMGKKRRVVAGAVDWPGLDRWGKSEEDALDKLSSYVPRYTAVVERAGLESAFARSREVEVIERVPGSSSTDFFGIAHVPSELERTVLSERDLERRVDLLGAGWELFDELATLVSVVAAKMISVDAISARTRLQIAVGRCIDVLGHDRLRTPRRGLE